MGRGRAAPWDAVGSSRGGAIVADHLTNIRSFKALLRFLGLDFGGLVVW